MPDKLDVLFSFIKSHLKNKIIVFFATCSQVRGTFLGNSLLACMLYLIFSLHLFSFLLYSKFIRTFFSFYFIHSNYFLSFHSNLLLFCVFLQVRFVFELFRGMQPGMPLTALHGKIKQERRTMVFQDFVR